MACIATLKRGHELDNYGHLDLSPKRRRCSTNRGNFAPAKTAQSSVAEKPKLDVESLIKSLPEASQFPSLSPLESSQILNEVTAGYKQLKRRRLVPKSPTHQSPQLPGSSILYSSPVDPRSSPSSSSDSDENSTSTKIKKISESIQEHRRCSSPESKKFTPDTQIRLTLRNVATICEVLLRQREDSIREEYDKVLQQKLSEQYEMFCRYSQDQLRQHKPSSSSSYIS